MIRSCISNLELVQADIPSRAAILSDMMSLMHTLRFWIAAVVLAAVVAILPFAFHAESHLETATRVEGSQAETVRQDLATRFRSPFVDRVILVITGLPSTRVAVSRWVSA